MDDSKLKQIESSIRMYDDLVAVALKARMQATYDEMARNMALSMFGDREPPRPLTMMERLRRKTNVYRQRVADAWLVLTGRADIGGDW